jgi:protein-L-isoaspartate O-methyltransferase
VRTQFFPTPPAVVDRVIRAAGLEPGMTVLEPSAGLGAIASAVVPLVAAVDCIDINMQFADRLKFGAGARTVQVADFLDVPAQAVYDRVLMNPPFAKKADIAHVVHAHRFLAPGGLLVAVMSAGTSFRADKVTTAFREGLLAAGGTIEALPEQAFRESGTDIRTVLVTIPAGASLHLPAPEPRRRGKRSPEEARQRADAKRQRVDDLIGAHLEQLTTPEAWAAFLRRGSSLDRYSLRNLLLILQQCPVASDVAGFVEWQERGRQVREGEEGLLILAPRTRKAPADGADREPEPGEDTVRKMAGVKVTSVFDISQTDPIAGCEFRPAATAQAKTFAEIREAIAELAGDQADAVLKAMDAGAKMLTA